MERRAKAQRQLLIQNGPKTTIYHYGDTRRRRSSIIPTIHAVGLPRDEGRLVTKQESHHPGNLVRRSPSPQRRRSCYKRVRLRLADLTLRLREHGCLDPAGSDGVHPDTSLRTLVRNLFGESHDAVLGSAVRRRGSGGANARDAGGIDDAAAAL